jgi:hypothetical protein
MWCGMADLAGPWDALLRGPRHRMTPPADDAPASRAGTKLSTLLAELDQRIDATTLTLAVCTDLTPRQVWGLLKAPRACGQVRFEDGRWSLVREFAGRDVEKAAALLRARGWAVQPPNV